MGVGEYPTEASNLNYESITIILSYLVFGHAKAICGRLERVFDKLICWPMLCPFASRYHCSFFMLQRLYMVGCKPAVLSTGGRAYFKF